MTDITIYEELDARADAGGSLTSTPRGKVNDFMDTFTQTSYIGLRKKDDSITFAYSGKQSEVQDIADFLDRNLGEPFWYAFIHGMPARMWRCDEPYTLSHVSGLRFSISATFKQATHYLDSITDNELELFANPLDRATNILFPAAVQHE